MGETSAAKTLTLTNRSGASVTPTAPVVPAGFAITGLDTNCANLADTKSCTFTVTFTPTAAGAYSSKLNVVMSTTTTLTVTLTGTGK